MENFNEMKTLIIILFLPVIALSQIKARVIGVKDGDTIVVLTEDNNQMILRLSEVDCPEKGQPFGLAAKKFTSDYVYNKSVEFKVVSKDRYGRMIAKVYISSKYLSEEIINAGYGWWYYRYSDNNFLNQIQEKAKIRKVGLWAGKRPIEPWNYRRIGK